MTLYDYCDGKQVFSGGKYVMFSLSQTDLLCSDAELGFCLSVR